MKCDNCGCTWEYGKRYLKFAEPKNECPFCQNPLSSDGACIYLNQEPCPGKKDNPDIDCDGTFRGCKHHKI